LVRIALDEKPTSLFDALRLRSCLIQVLMGLRVGEIATLPADALHARDLTATKQAQTDTADRSDPSPPSKPEAMTDEHQRAD
jgi:hypothetical protein